LSNLIQDIGTEAEFDRLLSEAGRPVLVEFYKGGGCPTCLVITPIMKRLAEEYADRVAVARFELMKPWFAVTSHTLRERFEIKLLFPTVILFVAGEAKKRWILDYRLDAYRRALDKALSV
jgi:thiol-disulfide isomerase/thioredoxin